MYIIGTAKKDKDGIVYEKYYRCKTRHLFGKKYCDNHNHRGSTIEKAVIAEVKKVLGDKKKLLDAIKTEDDYKSNESASIDRALQKATLELKNLGNAIAKLGDSKNLLQQYRDKETEIESLEIQKNKIKTDKINREYTYENIKNITDTIDNLDTTEQKMLLRSIIKKVLVGPKKEDLEIIFYNLT